MKDIPVKETGDVLWDIAKAGATGAVGGAVAGSPGAVIGLLVGGLMAKDKNVKTFVVGTAAVGLVGLATGLFSNILGGDAGSEQ